MKYGKHQKVHGFVLTMSENPDDPFPDDHRGIEEDSARKSMVIQAVEDMKVYLYNRANEESRFDVLFHYDTRHDERGRCTRIDLHVTMTPVSTERKTIILAGGVH